MKLTFTPPPPKLEPVKAVEIEMPKVGTKNRQGKASFITSIPDKSKSAYEQRAEYIEMSYERTRVNGIKIAEGNI
jgi:hypothetical protein